MKRIRVIALLLAMVVAFSAFPMTASAASSKPGKVKITSIKAGKVSKSTNTATITIKWKRVSNATGYEIYEKDLDGKWIKLTSLGKKYTGLKVTNDSAGKRTFRVRAVKKSKKGSFTKKSIFIKSPLTLEQYLNISGGDTEYSEDGIEVKIKGNVISANAEASLLFESEENARQYIKDHQAESKKEYMKMIKDYRLKVGVKGVSVKEKYFWNGSEISSKTYKE